jgi:hypothetical protein
MVAHQARIEPNYEEWMAETKAIQERMKFVVDISLETTEAYLEKNEVNQGKIDIMMEAFLEEMNVESIGALEDRYGDRRLA